MVDVMAEMMGELYPEVLERKSHIEKVIHSEEESFSHTLDRGLNHFEKIMSNIGSGKTVSGSDAFKLYDTYGFPLDLTQLLARERELTVDEARFNELMTEQKKKAKEAGKFIDDSNEVDWVDITSGSDSEFVGYSTHQTESRIRKHANVEDKLLLVLDKTPFYAESGGQVGDVGVIKGSSGELKVLDVRKDNEMFVHICDGVLGDMEETFECFVDTQHRRSVKNNHTATHLMHKALKNVLGDHVNQAGSLVHPDYLRFDLTHFEKISNEEIIEIERMVNEQILFNTEVNVAIQGFDDAKKSGAEALFGEKYGEEVRVVKVGDYSLELCGGTHVDRTGDIGSFKITDESSLSSGVRRIVAVTGKQAIVQMQSNSNVLNELQSLLNTSPSGMVERIESLFKDKKELEKKLKRRPENENVDSKIMDKFETVGKHKMLVMKTQVSSMDDLKILGDTVFNRLPSGVAIIFAEGEEKPMAVVVVSKNLNEEGVLAGEIAKTVGGLMGGGGGGKPHLATAGGKDNSAIDDALSSMKKLINETLNR